LFKKTAAIRGLRLWQLRGFTGAIGGSQLLCIHPLICSFYFKELYFCFCAQFAPNAENHSMKNRSLFEARNYFRIQPSPSTTYHLLRCIVAAIGDFCRLSRKDIR
jgi:hypothetical protein